MCFLPGDCSEQPRKVLVEPRAHQLPTIVAVNTAMAALGRDGSWNLAVAFLDSLESLSLCMNVVTRNSLLSALNRNSIWERVLGVFARRGGVADAITYNVVTKTCSQVQRWQDAQIIATIMLVSTVQPDKYTYSSLLSDSGWQVACTMSRFGRGMLDAANYHASVGLAGRLSDWERPLQLISSMRTSSVQTDIRSFNELYASLHAYQWPFVILGLEAGRSPRPDTFRLNSAMDTCCKSRQWPLAVDIFSGFRSDRLEVDIIGSNCLIQAVKQQWQGAIGFLSHMAACWTVPDHASYTAAFGACHGSPQAIPRLMSEMSRQNLRQSAITCGAAINACEPAGCWQLALWILDRAMLDEICHSATISVCEKAQRWETAVQLLQGAVARRRVEPDAVSFSAAISACEARCMWAPSLSLFAEMAQMQIKRNHISFSSAAASCKGSRWSTMLHLLDGMVVQWKLDIASCSLVLGICEGQGLLHTMPDLIERTMHELELIIRPSAPLKWPHLCSGPEGDSMASPTMHSGVLNLQCLEQVLRAATLGALSSTRYMLPGSRTACGGDARPI